MPKTEAEYGNGEVFLLLLLLYASDVSVMHMSTSALQFGEHFGYSHRSDGLFQVKHRCTTSAGDKTRAIKDGEPERAK